MHFWTSLPNSEKLAFRPLNEKEILQPGHSPAFSTAAPCRWCSASQGLPELRLGGPLGRGVRELPTNAGVRVSAGRNWGWRRRRRRRSSGSRRCGGRRARVHLKSDSISEWKFFVKSKPVIHNPVFISTKTRKQSQVNLFSKRIPISILFTTLSIYFTLCLSRQRRQKCLLAPTNVT